MNNNNDIHLHMGDTFEDGHKPGIIRLKDENGSFATVNLYMEPHHLEQLRDTCQRQLDVINRVLPSNAPAEVLAAPYLSPPLTPPLEGQSFEMDLPDPLPDPLPRVEVIESHAAPVEEEKVIVLDESDTPF